MLLEVYYGIVGAGVVGVLGQHYLPKFKLKLKDVSLPKIKWPNLTVPRLSLESIRPMEAPKTNGIAEIRARMGLNPFGSEPPKTLAEIRQSMPRTAPPPTFRSTTMSRTVRNGGTTYTTGVGGGGGSVQTSYGGNGGGGGGAGGTASIASYLNAHEFQNPMGLALLARINQKYPWAQAILMQPQTFDNRDVLSLNLVWFNQAGKKLNAVLTVRYPDFQHIDMQHVNLDLMFKDACELIDKAEEKPVPVTVEKPGPIALTKPQLDVLKQTYPEYMNAVMKKKLEEIALRAPR